MRNKIKKLKKYLNNFSMNEIYGLLIRDRLYLNKKNINNLDKYLKSD